MRVAIIGRTEVLFETAQKIKAEGHEIALIITAKEMPDYKVTALDFEQLANLHNALFIFTEKINQPEVIEKIKSLGKIDIGISVNYSGVIANKIINLFPLGILNAHAGDLPKYRGNACPAWAIINGEKKIGLCIHRMIGGELDSGDITDREYYDLTINTKISQVYEWILKRVPEMFLKSILNLERNSDYVLEVQSKNPKNALRCYPRIPEDGKIDWSKTNLEILRLINVSSEPYIGSFCNYKGKKLIIWSANLLEDNEIYLAIPGQISKINKDDGTIEVICGQGKIKITEVAFEDTRIKPATIIKSIRDRLQ